jgi:hypothetical protein
MGATCRFLLQKMKFISVAAFAILSAITLSLPINQGAFQRRGLRDWFGIAFRKATQGGSASLLDDLPPEIQLQMLEYHSMSLEEAKTIASQRLSSSDGAELWAYQHFDPSKDNYAIIQQWKEMSESTAKNELKEKMMKNPTLKNILEENLKNAIQHDHL